jgi:hypothetical protein
MYLFKLKDLKNALSSLKFKNTELTKCQQLRQNLQNKSTDINKFCEISLRISTDVFTKIFFSPKIFISCRYRSVIINRKILHAITYIYSTNSGKFFQKYMSKNKKTCILNKKKHCSFDISIIREIISRGFFSFQKNFGKIS